MPHLPLNGIIPPLSPTLSSPRSLLQTCGMPPGWFQFMKVLHPLAVPGLAAAAVAAALADQE